MLGTLFHNFKFVAKATATIFENMKMVFPEERHNVRSATQA